MKMCERCDEDAVNGERYCKACRKVVMAEMKEAGYLKSVPLLWGNIHTSTRTREQAEDTHQTKHGARD